MPRGGRKFLTLQTTFLVVAVAAVLEVLQGALVQVALEVLGDSILLLSRDYLGWDLVNFSSLVAVGPREEPHNLCKVNK